MSHAMNEVVKCYICGLSAYHLWTGCISYFCPALAMKFYQRFYDCNPVEQRHLQIILRPWGALAIFAGIAGLTAVVEPEQHPAILGGLALLLVLRIGYRIGMRRELLAISGIAPRRNWISIACLALGVLILSWGTL